MNTLLDLPLADTPAHRLRQELSALIESIDELQSRVGPFLTARYQAVLGRLELQLLELQIEVLATRRRTESLQSGVNRGEPVTAASLAEIEQRIETELADWRRQVLAQEQVLTEARDFLAGLTFADADEAKRVKAAYRHLARWLHPDASPENGDLFEKYWPSVQDAYRRIDAALIEALLHLVEHAVSERSATQPTADRAVELDRLRALVFTHAERLLRLKAEPPHCYAGLLTDDAWVTARQAELEAAMAVESERLAQLVIRQAELLAHLAIGWPFAAGGVG